MTPDPRMEAPQEETPGDGAATDEAARAQSASPAPQAPGTLGAPFPPALNLGLFALTFASTILAGLLLDDVQRPAAPAVVQLLQRLGVSPETATSAAQLIPALPRAIAFAASLLGILLAHEMGHFLLARRHRVDATWPFFLPAPLISFIGTLGAMIQLRTLPRTKNALIDIGAAGPLCGFLVTLPVLVIGLRLSQVVPLTETLHHWTLFDALSIWQRTGDFPALRDGVDLGEPLLLQLLEYLRFGALSDTQTILFHPVAVAGWFGLFVTALNLLPLGQLDGGHILYAVSPRLHRLLGAPLSALLLALGVFTPFIGWMIWGLLTGTVLSRHPPLREPESLMGRGRALIVAASLLVFIVSFSPVPIAMLTP